MTDAMFHDFVAAASAVVGALIGLLSSAPSRSSSSPPALPASPASWELIGGPNIGLRRECTRTVRERSREGAD